MLRRRAQSQQQPLLSEPEPTNGGTKQERTYKMTDNGNSNMKVVVRVRPESEAELRSSCQTVVKVMDDHVVVFDAKEDQGPRFEREEGKKRRRPLLSRKPKDLQFAFDRIFDETVTQLEVFEHTTKSILDGLLDGINCSVFAYGATGAGKTFTMLGSADQPGVMFHTMMELYRRIDEMRSEKTCEVAVSYMEVYNESIRDLLEPSGPLTIREDANKGLVVSGLSRHQPKSADELLRMLASGNKRRTQHPTEANATSSRSHAVFQVFVNQKPRTASLTAQVTHAKMSLIDLAGSERATVTANRGARMREGANINRSLLALGNCINALAQNKGKSGHIPYRNSKLTRLLKDSLGGNCRTVMIANVSPSALSYEDTYNTLKYADRAKQIKTNLVRNVVNVDYHISRYRTIVNELQKEVVELKGRLEAQGPLKRQSFNFDEATRLQVIIQEVYSERCHLRRSKVDLLATERDILLRIFRKERDVGRIEVLTGNNLRIAKVHSKLAYLQEHLQQVRSRLVTLDDQLLKNSEKVSQMNTEVNSAIAAEKGNPTSFRAHIEALTSVARLESEGSYQRKQTKQLLKYVKNKEQETLQTERILALSLELVCRQHQLLRCSGVLTSSVTDMYESLVRLTEGEKEVIWADQTTDEGIVHTQAQQALLKSLVALNSPARNSSVQRYSSPAFSSVGILTSLSDMRYSPKRLLEVPKSDDRPLSSYQMAPNQQTDPDSISLSGRILTQPVASPGRRRASFPPNPPLPHSVSEDTDHGDHPLRRGPSNPKSPLLSSTKMTSITRTPDSSPKHIKHPPISTLTNSSSNSSLKKLNLSELTLVHPTPPGSPSTRMINGFEDSFVQNQQPSGFKRVAPQEGQLAHHTPLHRQAAVVISPPPPPPPLPSHLSSLHRPMNHMSPLPMLSPLARLLPRNSYKSTPTRSPFQATPAFPSPLSQPQFNSSSQLPGSQPMPVSPSIPRKQQRDSSPQYQPRSDQENEHYDQLNSTFTISSSTTLTKRLPTGKSHTSLNSSGEAEAAERRENRALAPLQSNSTSERKQPSYLALTKSAANKRVHVNDSRVSAKENQQTSAFRKPGSGSLNLRPKQQRPALNRSTSFRSRSALLSNS